MKRIAIVKFTLMFEPGADTWSTGSELETDLGKFLAALGLEGEAVTTIGGSGERMFYVKKMDNLDKFRNTGATENNDPRTALDKATKVVGKKK